MMIKQLPEVDQLLSRNPDLSKKANADLSLVKIDERVRSNRYLMI